MPEDEVEQRRAERVSDIEDILDVGPNQKEDLTHVPDIEDSIRAELELAQEIANDPTNWDLTEISGRLFTIEKFLNIKDKVEGYDPRCIALAKTNLEQAIMWLNKAFFQEMRKTKPIATYEGEEKGKTE